MNKSELDALIDQSILKQFDAIVLDEFYGRIESLVRGMDVHLRYWFNDLSRSVFRTIEISSDEARVRFSRAVDDRKSGLIFVSIENSVMRTSFSLHDFCWIFHPDEMKRVKDDWQSTLRFCIAILLNDCKNILTHSIQVQISSVHPRDAMDGYRNFWEQEEMSRGWSFYKGAYPCIASQIARNIRSIMINLPSDLPTKTYFASIFFEKADRSSTDLWCFGEGDSIIFKCSKSLVENRSEYHRKARVTEDVLRLSVSQSASADEISAVQDHFFHELGRLGCL